MAVPKTLEPPPKAPPRPRRLRARPVSLSLAQILAWADDHFAQTGDWPDQTSGNILATLNEKWFNIQGALLKGYRGLPGGDSLAKLLQRERGVRNHKALPPLSCELILSWADDHLAQTGDWPNDRTGNVLASPSEKWGNLDIALRVGNRGLPGGDSLPQLLHRERGVRNQRALPTLTCEQILAWGDHHFAQTGDWPYRESGDVLADPNEKWSLIDTALRIACRGLPGGDSLSRLLQRERGVPKVRPRVQITCEQILAWADDHFAKTGEWPTWNSGAVLAVSNQSWLNLNRALSAGRCGLPGGDTVATLLERERGVRKPSAPELSCEQILLWADAHHQRTGSWPTMDSGTLVEAPDENWERINSALYEGNRGLAGGDTLPRLLQRERGVRNLKALPPFSESQILQWADAFHEKTGRWPISKDGPIEDSDGESWGAVEAALQTGGRGFPGGTSLARLLKHHRGVRNPKDLPPLSEEQILAWAQQHHERTGEWPGEKSGPIEGAAEGEDWRRVGGSLRAGTRGLPGGDTLAKLLSRRLGLRNRKRLPPLTIEAILGWAEAHQQRTGCWPAINSGDIPDSDGETWAAIGYALANGRRGLPGSDSLAKLLARHGRTAAE